ncbi:MAG: hypothetical protein ACR2OY_06105, partial [Boseongicola sp.]
MTDSPAAKETWRIFLVAFAATFAAMLLTEGMNLVDPFVRQDDFPALLGNQDQYFSKTLSEGRWLNYWWHARPFLWPAPVNNIVFLVGWSLYASATAAMSLGTHSHPWYIIALSLMIVIGPQATSIALWFNTLIPGVWILAIFAVANLRFGLNFVRWSLLIFVPLTLLAYSTYPFLILATFLARHDQKRTVAD